MKTDTDSMKADGLLSTGHQQPMLAGVHVLVVEDDDDSREVLKMILEYHGAFVSAASSARAALALFGMHRVDVLVSEVLMPREDGLWLIRAVRKLPPDKGGHVPALAITSHDFLREPARAAGFDASTLRPIDLGAFCEMTAALATGSRTSASPSAR
jgi:CheY-like chemotaxis protein